MSESVSLYLCLRPNCQCVSVENGHLKCLPTSAAVGEVGPTKGSQERAPPQGVLEIQSLSIKIEGGPNISAHQAYLSKQEHFALLGS